MLFGQPMRKTQIAKVINNNIFSFEESQKFKEKLKKKIIRMHFWTRIESNKEE